MTSWGNRTESDGKDRPGPITEVERAALHAILDELAGVDRASFEQLMAENADLASAHLLAPALQQRIQEALTHDADPAFAPVAGQVVAQLDARRQAADTIASLPADAIGVKPIGADDLEAPGVFTELTRELSPEHAQALYRKITPLVVFEVMRALDQSANIAIVQRIADRLCSDDVLARLRSSTHVRDGIIEELRSHVAASASSGILDRQRLLAIMEQCGALGDVNTMANCIRLSKIKAG